MKDDLLDDIIRKFLEGDATPHEKRMLANWLKEEPANEELFYYHLSKHENESPQYLPEVESKLETFGKFMDGEIRMQDSDSRHGEGSHFTYSRPGNYKWLVAASLTILISAGFYFLRDVFVYETFIAENGMVKPVILPDGSKVTLNANSSIRVPRDFMGNENREVWIRGEAFFEVTRKTDLMKFVVHTDNFDVEVLGTKFNINNRRGKTEVMLAEGKVKLLARDRQPLIMKPGERVTLSKKQAHFEKKVVRAERYEAWRNNKLVFENTPLAEVADIINDYYGVKIIITDALLSRKQFTGTLPNNDLDVILAALKTAYKIDIKRDKEQIILN